MSSQSFHIGFLVFPNLTQLDLAGPFEVFARMPGSTLHLIGKSLDPVTADSGLRLLPTATFETAPTLDVICVPGGPGVDDLLEDEATLDYLRRSAAEARYVTSVCTGSLVLGAAGLLAGKRAASHWMSRHLLEAFGAEPLALRTVTDGNLITGGGVTAGIDFALKVVAKVRGDELAREIQLAIEYDPAPPFDSGSPATAAPELVERQTRRASHMAARTEKVRRAAAKLALSQPAA